jgi:hypothetical protein
VFAGLHHVQLAMPEGQEARARAFFVDVLGITEIDKSASLAARGGASFRTCGREVHLGVEDDFRPAQRAHFPGFRRFYAHDPFGNRLEFLEAKDG